MKTRNFLLGPLHIFLSEDSEGSLNDNDLSKALSKSELEIADTFKHPRRKEEFIKGRALVRTADPKAAPVLRNIDGMPLWPKGVVGSISHKNSCVAVSVDAKKIFMAIGIDLEIPSEMPMSVLEQICQDDEIKIVEREELGRTETLALIFSAKESLFKCCYPTSQIWFGFHDAMFLKKNDEAKTFSIKLLKNLPPYFHANQIFEGHFSFFRWGEKTFLITGISVQVSNY